MQSFGPAKRPIVNRFEQAADWRAAKNVQSFASTAIKSSFTDSDLEYFDLVARVPEPRNNPFGPKVLPM